MSDLETMKKREEATLTHTYGRYPLAVDHAKGSRLYGPGGEVYVDLLSGIAVTSLGHCRRELAKVMAAQSAKLVHVSNLFYQEEQLLLAERLLSTTHADKAFFCNSGAEANEAAFKLARRYMREAKGRDAYEIITLEGSFHGRTLATLAATGQDKLKIGFEPMPEGFTQVPFEDKEALKKAVTDKTAAIMVEMIQGEGGVRPLSREYVALLEELRREHGILLMVDEIQTGMCRTGSFWAHQGYDLKPDVFTCAKALANGLPMGAMLATDEAAKGFTPGAHGSTFGGGALVSAVAAEVVRIMLAEDLAGRAAQMGAFAMDLFAKLKDAHPDKIADLRGAGLMIGIELAFPGKPVFDALLAKGFVLNLTQDKVLRLLPPLVIEESDLQAFAKALDAELSRA